MKHASPQPLTVPPPPLVLNCNCLSSPALKITALALHDFLIIASRILLFYRECRNISYIVMIRSTRLPVFPGVPRIGPVTARHAQFNAQYICVCILLVEFITCNKLNDFGLRDGRGSLSVIKVITRCRALVWLTADRRGPESPESRSLGVSDIDDHPMTDS